VQITLNADIEVPSKLPPLNRGLPPGGYSLPGLLDGQTHLHYLQVSPYSSCGVDELSNVAFFILILIL